MAEPQPRHYDGISTPSTTIGEPRKEWRDFVGGIKLREPHDPAQFRRGRDLTPAELTALHERGLFPAVITFLNNEQQRGLAHRRKHGAGPMTLGVSSQQLYVPPELLLSNMDTEEPLKFTIIDLGYQVSVQ